MIQDIDFHDIGVDSVTWTAQHQPLDPDQAIDETAIDVHDVFFSYGHQPAVEAASFSVRRGEFVALAGPNGSGKSTLLKMLVGLLAPQSGTVRILGTDPRRLRERWRLGYVPQRPARADHLPATVEEVVASGRLARRGWWRRPNARDARAVRKALSAVSLSDLADRRLGQLSGGQQQRAFIARALVTEPKVLILDEPIAGVDAESQELFNSTLTTLVRGKGTAVLLVSHELSAVARSLDRLVLLKRTVLFDGPPAELASAEKAGQRFGLWLEGLG